MQNKIEEILTYVKQKIEEIKTSAECQTLRVEVLGKSGKLTELFRFMKDVPKEQKQEMGQLLNKAKNEVEQLIDAKETLLADAELEAKLMKEKIDVTLDTNEDEIGALHPVTIDFIRMGEILTGMGFSQIDGPEIELDKYNFELVNVPKDHPSRDMQDSLYITPEILMRTQATLNQGRWKKSNHLLKCSVLAEFSVKMKLMQLTLLLSTNLKAFTLTKKCHLQI